MHTLSGGSTATTQLIIIDYIASPPCELRTALKNHGENYKRGTFSEGSSAKRSVVSNVWSSSSRTCRVV